MFQSASLELNSLAFSSSQIPLYPKTFSYFSFHFFLYGSRRNRTGRGFIYIDAFLSEPPEYNNSFSTTLLVHQIVK